MPAATRLGDKCTGHDSYKPRPNNKASTDVFFNSIGAHRVSDTWQQHTNNSNSHGGTTSAGSTYVFINGLASARIGDPISCGSVIAEGSPNVFIGDAAPDSPPAKSLVISDAVAENVTTYVESKIVKGNNVSGFPDVTPYEHSSVESDDEGAPSDVGGTVALTNLKQTMVKATSQTGGVDISTPPTVTDTATVAPATAVVNGSYNYTDIDSATAFTTSFQLSPNFTLGMLTTNTRVSSYALKAQFTSGREYTEKEIVRNLRDLAYNILEPLKATYPNMIINSGFRHDSGKSQHARGQGSDIAFPGLDTNADAAYTRAQEIANSSLPYDQFIFEQNNTIWFHLSYDGSKPSQRRMVMSKPRGVDKPYQGLTKVA